MNDRDVERIVDATLPSRDREGHTERVALRRRIKALLRKRAQAAAEAYATGDFDRLRPQHIMNAVLGRTDG